MWEGGVTSLYYVRARWYDPATRSFISEDPLGLSGGRNTYAYGDNDPMDGSDPSGDYIPACYYWRYDDEPESANRFLYCDAPDFTDPNGISGVADTNGDPPPVDGGGFGFSAGGEGGGNTAPASVKSRILQGLRNWSPECQEAKADFAATAVLDASFAFGVGEIVEGTKAAVFAFKAGTEAFLTSSVWLGTERFASASAKLASEEEGQKVIARVYVGHAGADYANTLQKGPAGLTGTLSWKDLIPGVDLYQSGERYLDACAP